MIASDTTLPTATRPPRDDRGTMVDLFLRNVTDHGDRLALVDGDRRLTWREYWELAAAVALNLRDLGVRPGDVVGLHIVNRAEHHVADVAALLAGAVPTSFYYTLSDEQLTYVAGDVGATVVVVDRDALASWERVRDDLPALQHVVLVGDERPPSWARPWDQLTSGVDVVGRRAELDEVHAARTPQDTLTIIYTSGTTGPPKGTIVTHGGIRFTVEQAGRVIGDAAPRLPPGPHEAHMRDGRLVLPVGMAILSYLPAAHIAERFSCLYTSWFYAWTVHCVRQLDQLPAMLPAVRPDSFVAVPRVWEKFLAGITARIASEPDDRKRALGQRALAVARDVGRARLEGRRPSLSLRLQHALFERLVYRRLRAAMGLDRALLAWSGAASIPPDVLATFTGVGLIISEVYGMTETSSLVTVTPPGEARAGSVGRPLPGIEVRIAGDGEVLTRGPHVTPGYRGKPDATAAAIDEDGWLHTGDLGELGADGHLRIVGRKKELIILASGKNIAPTAVEGVVASSSPIIGQVLAHGDGQPYVTALIVLDAEATEAWGRSRGLSLASVEAAVGDPAVLAEVERAVAAGNARLARIEQVKRWTVLGAEWTPESGELTPTMKLKRRVVHDRYADELASLYD